MIPDVDIAAKVGKDLFLDEKIPRLKSGQGYVRVVEHAIGYCGRTRKTPKFSHTKGNDMHESRQELDDNEQRIQPRTIQERGGRAQSSTVPSKGGGTRGAARNCGYRSPTWRVL